MLEVSEKHDVLARAVLRSISADYFPSEEPFADAEREYAREMVAIAARDLVMAIDALTGPDQPVGWRSAPYVKTGGPGCGGALPRSARKVARLSPR